MLLQITPLLTHAVSTQRIGLLVLFSMGILTMIISALRVVNLARVDYVSLLSLLQRRLADSISHRPTSLAPRPFRFSGRRLSPPSAL